MAATSNVPLAMGFKPAMTVLSRKPAPRTVATRDPVAGLEQLTVQDDGDGEDEDAAANKSRPTPEEIRMRQQKELEEKQRRYEEARAKIFGGPSNPSSGQSSPGTITPPKSSADGRQGQRGRGRGRARRPPRRPQAGAPQERRPGPPPAVREREPDRHSRAVRPKLLTQTGLHCPATRRRQQRLFSSAVVVVLREEEDQVIRAPRGPDGSGRGGFGFARRGASRTD